MNDGRHANWIPVLCTVLLLIQLAAYVDYFTDDSYIYARFATNLVAGGELVFNPGERVHAATSPLWAGLVAGIIAAGLPLVAGMKVLGASCAVAGREGAGQWAPVVAVPRECRAGRGRYCRDRGPSRKAPRPRVRHLESLAPWSIVARL